MKKLLIVLCFFTSCHSTLLLVNDSPFTLVAQVQGASGILLNQISIQPGEQSNWTQDLIPTNLDTPGVSNVSLTPYIVLWKCANGGFYSTCTNVSPGSLVKASLCSGAHYCKPRDDDQNQDQQGQCPPCPICPTLPENQEESNTQDITP